MRQIFPTGILILFSLWSCKGNPNLGNQPIDDTINIINKSLQMALSTQYMPGADAVKRPYIFYDSVLLTSNAIPLDKLPISVGIQKFKIMDERKLLDVLRTDSNNWDQPNYLDISRIERNDSGYYIQVQNLSAFPFGGGGAMGLYFLKRGDSVTLVKSLGSFIN